MWPDVIVLLEPHIDDRLGLFDTAEPFRIKDLATQSAIEAFIVAVLLGVSRDIFVSV